MSEKEKSNESIGEMFSNIVETVGEVVSDVIESIEQSVEVLLNTEVNKEEKKESIVKDDQTNDLNEETRIGYQSALPQAGEPEEETPDSIEPDDKNEIEAAIAKARETGAEVIEKDELVAEWLPALPRKNIAKLYIQSPNRIFLYWSLAGNPIETLQKAFGNRANNYQLVTKLVNLQTNAENFAPANFNGSWWYNVYSNAAYRADVGFYAQNRPFIRLISSNTVNTPRAAPSPRADTAEDWIVSTRQFVQVLTASGYSHDVLGVAFGGGADGEIGEMSEDASTLAVANRFASVVAGELDLAELRWLLVSLASGASFADLQNMLSPAAIAWLKQTLATNPDALQPENVRTVLESIFGSEFVEIFADKNASSWERLAPVAVGASAIHFPEILFPQLRFPELRAAVNPSGENFGEGDYPEGLFLSSAEFISK